MCQPGRYGEAYFGTRCFQHPASTTQDMGPPEPGLPRMHSEPGPWFTLMEGFQGFVLARAPAAGRNGVGGADLALAI